MFASQHIQRLFGWEPDELIGKNMFEYILPEDGDRSRSVFRGLLLENKLENYQGRLVHKEGGYRHVIISARSIVRPGRAPTIVGVLRDITDKVQFRDNLEREKNRAEFYLDLLSHDIGNIHQGMNAWTSLALSVKEGDPLRSKALDQMDLLGKRSLKLVKNVLLLSRLKDMKQESHRVDIVPLVEKAMDDVRALFGQKAMEFSFRPSLPSIAIEAEELIEEAFFNLVHNAAKFQYEEPIKVDISMDVEDGKAVFEVADHGIGISDQQKEHLFDRHIKGSEYRYSGIGLSLVKELVIRYGGSMEVRDRIEGDTSKGARFVLRFPMAG